MVAVEAAMSTEPGHLPKPVSLEALLDLLTRLEPVLQLVPGRTEILVDYERNWRQFWKRIGSRTAYRYV